MAGFFSGGSDDSVNASVAEAEAAAREAEAAAARAEAAVADLTPFTGQTEEGEYTVPPADTDSDTLFLNQTGEWTAPATGSGAESLNDLTDVTIDGTPDNGQFLVYNDTDAEWKNIAVDIASTLTPGDGIDITNDVISIADDGVTSVKILNDAVTTEKLVDNAVTTDKITDLNVTTGKLADNSINALKLNVVDNGDSGQILSSDGDGSFSWVDDNNTDTTYTAGEGLDLTGTVFSVEDAGIDNTKLNITNADAADELVLSKNGDNFTWVANTGGGGGTDNITASGGLQRVADDISIVDLGVTSGKIAASAVGSAKINVTGTDAVGSVLASDGAGAFTWAVETDTTYTNGTGLDLTGTTFSIANNGVSAQQLNVVDNGTSGQLLSSDGDGSFTWVTESGGTQYTADGSTLALSAGNVFSVATGGITDNEIASDAVNTAEIVDDAVTLAKISITNPDAANGQVLSKADNGFTLVPQAAGSLEGLSDTTIPSNITARSLLEYEPSQNTWRSTALSDILILSDMFDVEISNAANNQFLRFDSNTTKWMNETVSIPPALTFTTGLNRTGNTVSVPTDGIVAGLIADDAVDTGEIKDNAVTNAKIGPLAVDTAELAAVSVTNAKIADTTITAAKIANNTITAVQLATDSVTPFKIQADAVTTVKINDGAVTEPKLAVTNAGTNGQVLSRADTGFTWIDNGSGGTTYTADEDTLTLTGTVFSVNPKGIDTPELADNSIDALQLNVSGNGANTQFLKSNGTGSFEWAIPTDTNTTYTNGTGLNLTGTEFSINPAVGVSVFTDVNTSGANSNQVLGYNGTTWVPVNQSGGGNTDNSRLAITLVPTSLSEDDPNTQVDITLSIADAQSGETISLQSVTVVDPLGHTVTVSGSGNSWMFGGDGTNVGNYVIRASATLTLEGAATGTVHSTTANLPVIASNMDWFTLISATVPTDTASMTDEGTFNSPQTGTVTGAGNAGSLRKAYYAVPTRTGGSPFFGYMLSFTFSGYPLSVPVRIGTINTNYDLFQINDADFTDTLAGDLNFTITEV